MSYIVEEYLMYLNEIDEILSEIPGGSAAPALAGAAGTAVAAGGMTAAMPYLMAAASIFSIFNISYQLYKTYFSKAARQCKDLPGKEKAVCMLRAKAKAKEVQLNALKKGKTKCMKSKDPQKCAQKFDQKMSKVGGEAGFFKSRMAQLSQQKYGE
jgi:hypothetical protein